MERHNQSLTDILLKGKRDNRCDWRVALDCALMTKNCMHNVHQLVFGQNPNLPFSLTTLESTHMSTWIAQGNYFGNGLICAILF